MRRLGIRNKENDFEHYQSPYLIRIWQHGSHVNVFICNSTVMFVETTPVLWCR
jgi:hypothetical protein